MRDYHQFLDQVSHRLRNFKWVSRNHANFSCPFCGDSRKDRSKTRGYVLYDGNSPAFYCHNCHEAISFGSFLNKLDPSLYHEYNFSKLSDKPPESFSDIKHTKKPKKALKPTNEKTDVHKFVDEMTVIEDLDRNHQAREYLRNRNIHEKYFDNIFYLPEENKIGLLERYHGKFKGKTGSRIVFPTTDISGCLTGFVCRTMNPENDLRYITLKIFDKDLVYGFRGLDMTKRVYAVEGIFDSFLLPNCLASLSSDFSRIKALGIKDLIIIRDNEPRSKIIQPLWQRDLDDGCRMMIWPKEIESKDLQDCVSDGEIPLRGMEDFVNRNAYDGFEAKLKYEAWRV